MKHTHRSTSLLAVALIASATTFFITRTPSLSQAQSQARPSNGPLAFGVLKLEDGKYVFRQGHSRIEITPAPGALAGGRVGGRTLDNGYRFDEFTERNDLPAALDALAEIQGWNAVSFETDKDGNMTVLMRRVQ